MYKNKDITANINATNINLGSIKAKFYTEDENVASIRITVKNDGRTVDLTRYDMTPKLDVFSSDGSIFLDEELTIINPEIGLIQYNIPTNVIKHAGETVAKLFLVSESKSIHVANFSFTIEDSGLEKAVAKEIDVDIAKQTVSKIIETNPEMFKGPKGDPLNFKDLTEEQKQELRGEQGIQGVRGDAPNFLKVTGQYDFTAYQPIAPNEYNAMRYFKDTSDEFMKGYDNYVANIGVDIVENTKKEDFTEVIKGSMVESPTNDNPYTTTIGTKIKYDFYGTSITLTALADNRGGMWRASIDGNFVKDISVYSGTSNTSDFIIADNLENTNHTLILEFVGQDPKNPVSSPRGWIRVGRVNKNYNSFTTKYLSEQPIDKKIIDVAFPSSNKEYAINVRDKDKTIKGNFFPMHSGVKTSFIGDNYVRQLIVDGKEVSLESVSEAIYFNEATFIQKVEHKLPSDDSIRCEATFIVTFKDSKVYNDVKFKWFKPSEVTSGFVFQVPFDYNYLDYFINDSREQVAKSDVPNTITTLKNKDSHLYQGISNNEVGKDYVYSCTVTRATVEMSTLWLQHRDTRLQKVYPQYYQGTVKEPGEIDLFSGYYEIKKIKDANKVFKV